MKLHSILALAALAASGPALASGVSLDILRAASADLASASGRPIEASVADPALQPGFARFTESRLSVTPEALALIGSPNEARAFVALAIAYQGVWFATPADRRKSKLDYVTWIPAIIADSKSTDTLPDARAIPNFTREELRERDNAVRSQRAALAVSLASKAGSCAGPMVDLLRRMRGTAGGAASTVEQPSGFARQVLRDLGHSAYPPDRSCE